MKLLTAMAPNPFRVQAFMAEKGISIPLERVDIRGGATRSPEFLKNINSMGELPVLQLDDGSYLPETIAICRYLESRFPETPLFGDSPELQARIEMWNRRMELRVMAPMDGYARHSFEFFKDKVEQIPAFAESQKRLQMERWQWLDQELSDGRTYLADDYFSVADITGMALIMVCGFADMPIPDELQHVKRWEAALCARPGWTQPHEAMQAA